MLATMVIHGERTAKTSWKTLVDRLPGTWSKREMNFLRRIVGWVRSRADALWKAFAPRAGPGAAWRSGGRHGAASPRTRHRERHDVSGCTMARARRHVGTTAAATRSRNRSTVVSLGCGDFLRRMTI